MYLLYCDETNFAKRSGDFFVYGGIAIEATRAAALSEEIESIRRNLGVGRDYLLKFNPGPEGFSHDKFVELKRSVIAAAVRHECVLLVNLLLHDIAKSSEEARRNCINTLCYHFDCFLNRPNVGGLVLIDRFDDKSLDGQLKEKLSVGLTGRLPYSSEMKLKHILGYHLTAIGQSHFCSLVDVVLGSLRFAVNAFTQGATQHLGTSRSIVAQLSPMFFREGQDRVHEISFWLSPKEVKVDKYLQQYRALIGYLHEGGLSIAQAH